MIIIFFFSQKYGRNISVSDKKIIWFTKKN